jgi:hypothetical protein
MVKKPTSAMLAAVVNGIMLALCLHTDAFGQAARRTGEGFEFRRKPAVIYNPYCDILTYVLPDFSQLASSTEDAAENPVIVIDAGTLRHDRAYARFLMAHECCHHTLGHARLTSRRSAQLGPQPFYYLRPKLKDMELEADACAVRILKRMEEAEAIEVARDRMLEFGDQQTGAYYPTGVERAANIVNTAAEERGE